MTLNETGSAVDSATMALLAAAAAGDVNAFELLRVDALGNPDTQAVFISGHMDGPWLPWVAALAHGDPASVHGTSPTTPYLSPWGEVQWETRYADGIKQVETASHGGFLLGCEQNIKVPAPFRSRDGSYEEDVDAAAVILTFPELFHRRSTQAAIATLRNYYPEEWVKVTGESLTGDDSVVIAESEFLALRRNDWIAVAAWGDWHEDVPDGSVGVVCYKGGNRDADERFYLVGKSAYDQRSTFGYVVNSCEDVEVIGPF